MALADLTVNVDFSRRGLGILSNNTITTRDLSTAVARPDLNLSGTLIYSSGSSAFAGTLANASATMSGTSKGRFYGPAAQELGGVFSIKAPSGPESFVGAYGAKR